MSDNVNKTKDGTNVVHLMKQYKLHFTTWNVGDGPYLGSNPTDLYHFLGVADPNDLPDLIAIGLQEVVNDKSWSSGFQAALKPFDYVLIKVRNLWAIWLFVYVRRQHLSSITNVESEVTASGYAGIMGNKGGVSVRFDWHTVNLIIVCAHFTAHVENYEERINDYVDIIKGQKFRDPDVDTVLDHDYVFWMGDLNFRVEKMLKQDCEMKVKNQEFEELTKSDQLLRAIRENLLFHNFKEGALTFPPTYRYDRGTNVYDTSKKQRCPSWTDRILYLVNEDGPFKLGNSVLRYTSLMQYLQSDHKPVVALYETTFPELKLPYLPVTFVSPLGVKGVSLSDNTNSLRHDDKNDRPHAKDIAEFSYYVNPTVDPTFRLDPWDWIALLPEDYHSIDKDYFTYIYVPTSDIKAASKGPVKGTIERKHLNNLGGRTVVLAYFSKKKNCIQGISKPFMIAPC